jgi:hypothetical protein
VTDGNEPAKKSWNVKIPTSGGPVAYLNIFDGQPEIRMPEEVPMGDAGTYYYSADSYRWLSNTGF